MKTLILRLFILSIALLSLNACKQNQSDDIVIQSVNTGGQDALDPYLTVDNKGNPVLCWTEKDSNDSLYRLKYAIYNVKSDSFGPALTVSVSSGISPTAESMGKIAFKSDGTVFAVFGKRFPNEKNPFAGAIYYCFSKDQGRTWSQPDYLHSDTSHSYGRNFFDIATLKNGELAVIWLDGRYAGTIKGSALFFSRTEKDKGFTKDSCLVKGTCECCRTDILSDEAGNIHIAYRDIAFPSQLSGKQVRDMTYIVSKDRGRTFSSPVPISKDNWAIDGCPHSGPALSLTNNTVNAVWFTGGGGPGLYFTSLNNTGPDFKPRKMLTSSGRHPQMVAFGDKLALVYEESAQRHHETSMDMKQGMAMRHNQPVGEAKIVLRILSDGESKIIDITDGKQPDHHAVITNTSKGVLVAWIREKNGRPGICYSQINVN